MPKRSTNIYKRKDGRWEARYVKTINADGSKKYGSVYAKSYQAAKERQLAMLKKVRPEVKTAETITIEQLMQRWLDSASNAIKKSTYQKYACMIQNHLTEGLGKLQASSVSGEMLDRYAAELLDKLSPRTVNDILTIVSLAYKFGELEYGIQKPPIRRVKVPQTEMRVLSIEEQKVLEKYLLSEMDQYKFGVLLALYTGLRIGELCALEWEDIQSDRLLVTKTLHRIKAETGTKIEITTPKTSASNRIVPLPPPLQTLLSQFSSTGAVIKSPAGKVAEPRLLQLKFDKYIRECGLEKTNFHALRHTFATRCVEAGFDVKTLSEILGHTDVKTTLNRYVHSSFALKQQNMAKLKMQVQP